MAVDLPPPMPPQPAAMVQVRRNKEVASFAAHGYQVHVYGSRKLDAKRQGEIVRGADTISNGLRALNAAYYAAGYPGAKLSYAVVGKEVYVQVILAGVASVNAEGPLAKYFVDLPQDQRLTADGLEPRRTLASMHADRAGLHGKTTLTPNAGVGSVFALRTEEGPRSTHANLEFGNPGNRYVGRYFADLELSTGTRWGDELRSLTRTTVPGLEDGTVQGDYLGQDLGWNRVTTWGIFGLGGRWVDYSFDAVPGATLDGELWVGEVRWQYPLMADFDSRLTTQAKIDRTSKTTELAQTGAVLQRELYNSAELSGTYQHVANRTDTRWDVDTGLALRQGLGDGKAPIAAPASAPDLDYTLARVALVVRYHFAPEYSLALEGSGQYSADTVPEQQQVVLGGFGSLNSALPGLAAGDSGVLARIVGALGMYRLVGLEWRPKLYVDGGYADFNELGGGSPAIADVGGQLDFVRGSWFEGSLAYAENVWDRDLSDASLNIADANLYFRVRFKY